MMAATVSAFIAAAATGAFLRFVMSLAIPSPWTTFTANLIGSLIIGFLFVYLDKYSTATKTVVFVAFLGSLTTYSGFALDCVKLANQSAWRTLALYFFLSNCMCILGCVAGWQIAKKLVIKF